MERQLSSQEYVGLGEQPPQDRSELLWYRITCGIFTVLMCMVLALVVTGTCYVFRENERSYSTTTTFSEHTTITATTKFMESKVYNILKSNKNSNAVTSQDIPALTSSSESNSETSSATVLVTKKTTKQKIHKKPDNSTSSEMKLIAMPPSVEVSRTSVNAFYDSSTQSYGKHKEKKRKSFNSLTNKFEVMDVIKASTESKPNFQPSKRDPRTHTNF